MRRAAPSLIQACSTAFSILRKIGSMANPMSSLISKRANNPIAFVDLVALTAVPIIAVCAALPHAARQFIIWIGHHMDRRHREHDANES